MSFPQTSTTPPQVHLGAPPTRREYSGSTRKLVLAFDLGTTFSGISYREVPEIKHVDRAPSQGTKVPSIIYYDTEGNPCAIGAEILKEGIEVDAQDNGWFKAQWCARPSLPAEVFSQPYFLRLKHHLCPPSNAGPSFAPMELLPPLPPGKSVVQVVSDFMRYLLACAKAFIQQHHGSELWSAVEPTITFVFTQANEWGSPQQAQLRQAAVLAGLVPDTDEGGSRIVFVTEGEANLRFCLESGLPLASGDSATLVVDAGGGTIDLSAYRPTADGKFKEVSVPTCFPQGAAYVTVRAQHYFESLLCGTRFQDDIETLTSRFDSGTKHIFRDPGESYHIRFGSRRDRDPALNIRGGRLSVPG
ncbi:hypothetical protein NMY22_g777 [Coprinellus aureogranulatus]|nr:hypothetical protein NMY22_g777 [Coprinellus aureogranulatus]